ncbi:hypothetical protein [Ottowia thiooxydans]|uniref:hypothetical protein n=1 Tax=Ottowia thiooxydans TaxID=219182 RepID=UPI00040EFB7E|nr:hypothetical protein [Ottowia thiooxydans]
MNLIESFLPQYQFAEEHSRYIPASPARVLDVLERPEVVDDPIARGLIALRETPNRLAGRLGFSSNLQNRPSFSIANFVLLGRDGNQEIAYGLAGRFWQSDYGLVELPDAQAFRALDPSGVAKLVLNFSAEAEGAGTRLTTRTRVWCRDAEVRRRFQLYWLLIRPASGFIRRRLLKRAHDAALESQ